MIGPLAAALLAEPAVGRAVWRTKRSTIQIEKRSTNVPAYVWIIVAVAIITILAVVIGAVVVRLKRRRAPLPSSVAHVVPAARPTHTYAPYGEGHLPKHTYRPYNADELEEGQVPPYTQGGYALVGLKGEEKTPLSSVPELTRENGGRREGGVV